MSWISSPALDAPSWTAPPAPFVRDKLGFSALPEVRPLLPNFGIRFALQKLSSILSPVIFRGYYPESRRKKDDWDLHMVGWAYALVATPIALHCLLNPSIELDLDPLYGQALKEQRLSAIAVGYFTWDSLVTAGHIGTQGLAFFLHGFGCLNAFLFTLRPFLMWCGPSFLIWEFSTIFLNAHWLFDKLKMTGSTAQLINGVCLVVSYISARLIWGTYNSYRLWRLLLPSTADLSAKAILARETPLWIRGLYLFLNILMNSLNFYWFRLMVLALLKRFVPAAEHGADSRAARKALEKPLSNDVLKGKLPGEVEGRAKAE
ncbi:hypothetical protein JCM10213v2_002162 [Rhodosporidiobolus nylandii]